MKVDRLKCLIVFVSLGFSTLYADGLLYKNRDTVLNLLLNNSILLKDVDDIYKKDRALVLKTVDAYNYDDIDESLKSDKEILRKAIEKGYDLRKADENMSLDRDLVLSSVKNNNNNFEYAKDIFKKDKDFVFEVLGACYHNLMYADESLRKDREFILKIIKLYPYAFEYADESIKDKELALIAEKQADYLNMASLKKNGQGLDLVDENITDNREFVTEVIKKNPMAYRSVSPRLKKDKELLLLAFKSINDYGIYNMLMYADDTLKSDKELVLKILKLNSDQYKFIAPELKKDNDFILSIIKKTGKGLEYATKEQRSDKSLIIEALKLNTWAFSEADNSLKRDRAFILDEVAKVDYTNFIFSIDKSLLKDKSFVYELFKRNFFVENSPFYSDKALILKLINDTNGSVSLSYIDKNLFKDESFMLTAIKKAGQGLKYATKEQQNDKALVLKAISHENFDDSEFVGKSLLKDREFILKAIKINSNVMEYLSDTLKDNREFALKVVAINSFNILFIYLSD